MKARSARDCAPSLRACRYRPPLPCCSGEVEKQARRQFCLACFSGEGPVAGSGRGRLAGKHAPVARPVHRQPAPAGLAVAPRRAELPVVEVDEGQAQDDEDDDRDDVPPLPGETPPPGRPRGLPPRPRAAPALAAGALHRAKSTALVSRITTTLIW